MKYISFDAVRKETQLVEATAKLREIWYLLAEGFYEITNNYLEYSNLIFKLENVLPSGWSILLQKDGNISASYRLIDQNSILKIEKETTGYESVTVLYS